MNVVDPTELGRAAPKVLIAAQHEPVAPSPRRGRLAAWAVFWSLVILYGSVVLGPLGFHYVPIDSDTAWARFMAMPYVVQGSDQQADWMGNLLMLVPLGFAVAGTIWPRRGAWLRAAAAALAFVACVGFVLTIKYFQLSFPPRTVTLNYVFAQSLGSLVGIILYASPHGWAYRAAHYLSAGDVRALRICLAAYSVALLLFILFPFDFTFHAADLRDRLAALPDVVTSWPGQGRPLLVRVILVVFDTAATVPLGALAILMWPNLSMPRLVAFGMATMAAIFVVTSVDMSATPYLVAILYRTVGVIVGAELTGRLTRRGFAALLSLLGRLVPVLFPLYVLAVLLVFGVLTRQWRSLDISIAALDPRFLLPFWTDYIVSKAEAAASTVVQFVTYAPIGIMVTLRRGGRRGGTWIAIGAAVALSAVVELCKPVSAPDFADIFFAGIAAYVAVRLAPLMWRFTEATHIDTRPAVRARLESPAPAVPRAIPPREEFTPNTSRFGDEVRPTRVTPLQWAVAVPCLALTAAITMHYPVAPWALGAILVLYCMMLWRWPGAWLVVVPAILPTFDLTSWTGWVFLGEPDLFILVTIGVMALRAPPERRDFLLAEWPGRILLAFAIVYCVNIAIGLARPAPVEGSDNPFLRPDNALRLAKGFVEALALLPLLRARGRRVGDAAEKFGLGMLAGLAGVGAAAAIERALFPGLFDFTSDYRIVATFSSMNLGGGHVGAYVAMTLPFLVVCCIRPGAAKIGAMIAVVLLGGYTLIVTFARTAYAAAVFGLAAALAGWVLALRRGRRAGWTAAILPALLVTAVGGVVFAAAFGGTLMTGRLESIGADFGTRKGNWTGGLALRDGGAVAPLLGMGLGTYPRVVMEKRTGALAPTNFVVQRDGDRFVLSMSFGSAFYLTQRIPIEPNRTYRFSLRARTPDGHGTLSVALCENVLLYSDNCRTTKLDPGQDGAWRQLNAPLSSSGLDEDALFGVLRRPVQLSLSDPVPGSVIEIENVELTDAQGRNLLVNGDFASGMARWFFSDDDHLVWRIKNQYLMTLFECGIVGLGAFLLLAAAGIAGAVRSAMRGDLMQAAIVGSLAAFVCSCAFDYLLEAPRLATLFYLVCFIGLDAARIHDKSQPARRRESGFSP